MARIAHDHRTYVETALHRRPEQLAGIVRRKIENALLPRLPFDIDEHYSRKVPETVELVTDPFVINSQHLRLSLDRATRDSYRERATDAANGTVTFLNETYDFDPIEWQTTPLDAEPLMWWLKLQGCLHFEWPILGYEDGRAAPETVRTGYEQWFRTWSDSAEIAARPGFLRREWLPHSVSLRIINWARYLAWAGETLDAALADDISRQIYRNALFLTDHVETDIGGNHLVENAAALVAAGVLTDTDRFLDRGLRIFERAAATQFFEDGGHFERSPMYHIIVTRRFLTARDLLTASSRSVPTAIDKTCREAVTWLTAMKPPDGRIPLLNDSVFEEALSLSACRRYAEAVGVDIPSTSNGTDCPATGYYWLGTDESRLLVAAGPSAVPHLPAHAHVHPGHISLWIDGDRILCDTGTYSYAGDERRQFARGIEGHNTVQIGDHQPVAIADSFLMGDVIEPDVAVESGPATALATAYESAHGPAYRHRRDVIHGDGWWLVWDTIDTNCSEPVRARYHLHPDCSLGTTAGSGITVDGEQVSSAPIRREDGEVCHAVPVRAGGVHDERTAYFPRFGEHYQRDCLVVTLGDGTTSGGCLFSTEAEEVTLQTTDGRVSSITVDSNQQQIPRLQL